MEEKNNRPVPPALPWMEWEVGKRVVARYHGSEGVHDALGTLLEKEPGHVVIDTKRGPVKVLASTMIVGKQVPPKKLREIKPIHGLDFGA